MDRQLIFCCDGEDHQFVTALDSQTGVTTWKTNRGIKQDDPYSFSTPLAIEPNGRQEIICPAAGGIISYHPTIGRELWQVNLGAEYFSNVVRAR